jgi:hypothetical protein
MDEKYFVVEFRLPFEVLEANSPKDAAAKARRIFERDSGLDVSNWFTRVFQYSDEHGEVGPIKEWFANPSGSEFREVDQNIVEHDKRSKDGND